MKSFDKIETTLINGGWWGHWWINNNPKQNCAIVDSNYSFICSAYWEVVRTWFYFTGYRGTYLSKVFLHVHTQIGWIWKPLTIFFQFHCTVVAKINWTQQFWIGNQFINTEECKFTSHDLIMIMLILFWLLILAAEMFPIFKYYYNFMLLHFYRQCVGFCVQ